MNLDIDNELRVVEEFQRKLAELDALRARIGTEGISREIGLGLEDLCGGPIPGIDVRKLTANPSRASQVAVEAIDIKRVGMMFFGSIALLTLMIKMFSWLFSSSKGNPGGGGGGGGGAMSKELDKMVEEVEKEIERYREDPDDILRERWLQQDKYRNAPETVAVIMRLVLKNKSIGMEQASIIYARAYEWCKFFGMTNAVTECDNRNPAYLALLHLTLNQGTSLDMRICAFMDNVPAVSEQIAKSYEARHDIPGLRFARQGRHHRETTMTRYIDSRRMDEANNIAMMVDGTIEGIQSLLDLYEDMMNGRLRTDDQMGKYTKAVARMKEELFGERSKYRHVHKGNNSNPDSLLIMRPAELGEKDVLDAQLRYDLAGKPYDSITHDPSPYMMMTPSIWADSWKMYMEVLEDANISMTVPVRYTSEVELFPVKIQRFQTLYEFLFSNMNRIEDAVLDSKSREVDGFYKSINRISKKMEKESENLRERVKRMQKAGDEINYTLPHTPDGNMLRAMEKFLNTSVHASKMLIAYCKHVEIARKAADGWVFKIDL